MKQHIISLFLLVGIIACSEDATSTQDYSYTITWKDTSHTASAMLYLYDDGTATIKVDTPDFYFLHQKEEVSYLWKETDTNFMLQHSGNGFVMHYQIVDKGKEYLKLRFDDELSVEIRKAPSSQSLD